MKSNSSPECMNNFEEPQRGQRGRDIMEVISQCILVIYPSNGLQCFIQCKGS